MTRRNNSVRRERSRRALAVMRAATLRYPGELLRCIQEGRCPPRPEARTIPASFEHATLATTWLGHATVLMRLGGKTILTDPVLSDRIGFRVGKLTVGLARLDRVPVCPTNLPPIDIIAISHAHYDHLDRATLRRLVSPHTTVITARKTRRLIPRGFGRVIELDWECQALIDGVEFTSLRPKHWGARSGWDRHRGYNSYIIESRGQRVLYAGDTAETDAYSGLGKIDLAIFGIGAYDPWVEQHATPEQVWEMFRSFDGKRLLPIHHSTFKLSDEDRDEPLQRLLAAARPEEERIIASRPGDLWAA